MLSLHSPGLDLAKFIQSMNDDLVSIERTVKTLRQRLDEVAAARQTATVVAEALTLAGTAVPEIDCGDAPVAACATLETVVVDKPVIAGVFRSEQANVTPAGVLEGLAAEVVTSKEPNDAVAADEIVTVEAVAKTNATAVESAVVDTMSVDTPECDPVLELNSTSVAPMIATSHDETSVARGVAELAAALSAVENAEAALEGADEEFSGTVDIECGTRFTSVTTAADTASAAVAVECLALPAVLATADAITAPANSEIVDASAHTIAVDQAAPAIVETSVVVLHPAIVRDASTANKGATSRRTLGLLAAASVAIILLGSAALTWPEVQVLVAHF